MKNRYYSFLINIFVIITLSSAQDTWNLVWSDEFDTDGSPDQTKWSYDVGGGGWGNNELQYYTRSRSENARVENGVLVIELLKEPYENRNYTSARLVSKNKGDWLYGRIDVRAKLPTGKGTWPAIWMLPTDWEYGSWPQSGEIDIMEHVGYDPGVIHATVHTAAYNHSIGTQVGQSIRVQEVTDYHVYSVEWYPDRIDAYVDGVNYFTFTNQVNGALNSWEKWPFDKRFHVILNIAFGGTWGGAQGIDSTLTSAQMIIDYVRVYEAGNQSGPIPFIIMQPVNTTVIEGQQAVFSVQAGGYPLLYQWKRNGIDITGANGSQLTLPSVTMDDNGALFTALVSNDSGTILSNPATLTVSPFSGLQFFYTEQAVVIDGTDEDEVWGTTAFNQVARTINGTAASETDLKASFKGVWDMTGLYLLFIVHDDVLQSGAAQTWQDDGVEVYIDADNSKGSTYDDNDFQYRFPWNGMVEETKRTAVDRVEYCFREVRGGYVLEVKIPWSTLGTTPSDRMLMGFDIHVNDADIQGIRDTKIAWNSTEDNTYQTPSVMGTVQLIGFSTQIQKRAVTPVQQSIGCTRKLLLLKRGDYGRIRLWDLSGKLVRGMDTKTKKGNRLYLQKE